MSLSDLDNLCPVRGVAFMFCGQMKGFGGMSLNDLYTVLCDVPHAPFKFRFGVHVSVSIHRVVLPKISVDAPQSPYEIFRAVA